MDNAENIDEGDAEPYQAGSYGVERDNLIVGDFYRVEPFGGMTHVP